VILSDYDDLLDNLSRVPSGIERLVLCDLGADNANLEEFLNVLKKIAQDAEVTYIDHHFMTPTTKNKLKESRVRLVHSEEECSSILTYLTFKDTLPERARLIALLRLAAA